MILHRIVWLTFAPTCTPWPLLNRPRNHDRPPGLRLPHKLTLPPPCPVFAVAACKANSIPSLTHLGVSDPRAMDYDRALAKARSKLHVPTLWAPVRVKIVVA